MAGLWTHSSTFGWNISNNGFLSETYPRSDLNNTTLAVAEKGYKNSSCKLSPLSISPVKFSSRLDYQTWVSNDEASVILYYSQLERPFPSSIPLYINIYVHKTVYSKSWQTIDGNGYATQSSSKPPKEMRTAKLPVEWYPWIAVSS